MSDDEHAVRKFIAAWSRLDAVNLLLCLCCTVGAASATGEDSAPGKSPEESMSADWQPLFDGRTTDGWRNYQGDTISAGWQVVDGALTRVAEAGDIVTEAQYGNFELVLEWKVEPGGNSGVFFHADESEPYIFMTAPEVQVLDDAGHRDGGDPLTSAGACYGLYPAPRGVVRPADDWNQLRLLVQNGHVSQWLNGQPVATYEIGSADWQARVAASKFAEWPKFGTLERGHIGLQDHGDRVAFRDIRIRVLDAG